MAIASSKPIMASRVVHHTWCVVGDRARVCLYTIVYIYIFKRSYGGILDVSSFRVVFSITARSKRTLVRVVRVCVMCVCVDELSGFILANIEST